MNDAQRPAHRPSGHGDAQQVVAAAVAERAAGKKVVIHSIGALIDDVTPGVARGREARSPTTSSPPSTGSPSASSSTLFTADGEAQAGRHGRRHDPPREADAPREDQDGGRPGEPEARDRRRSAASPLSTSSCRSRCGSTPAASAARRPASPSRSRCSSSSAITSSTATRSPRRARSSSDGTVGPIGGIKQKTIGAREAGVDAFLVPAGENAQDARKEAGGLRIIPVKSFPQALRALATLR